MYLNIENKYKQVEHITYASAWIMKFFFLNECIFEKISSQNIFNTYVHKYQYQHPDKWTELFSFINGNWRPALPPAPPPPRKKNSA